MKGKDIYPQPLYLKATQTVANTVTEGTAVQVGSNLWDNKALEVHKIHFYYPSSTLQELAAAADLVGMAIATKTGITSITNDNASIVIQKSIYGVFDIVQQPVVIDYLNPIIIPAFKIYPYVFSASLANPVTVEAKLFFTVVDLNEMKYRELLQTLEMIT